MRCPAGPPLPRLQVKGLAARMPLAAACLELFVEAVKCELKTNLRRRTLAFYGHAVERLGRCQLLVERGWQTAACPHVPMSACTQ